ncbi:uncharacterized protein GGS22DRAFT_1477 [Annulohypoxylon maeteangense]|uniref:uncharacterized protein n=1 Tax=Annulohypoxylon maeteangense TaxID=1927788 RepID=UPI00200862A6|nr:uncharacterized protein GGS22DRAFT_1477 [Annulohypoxylon maeteangense]KAI0889583.1 hypothetical protein GGS22DRAFT_1477 [Annulohypoxylon maeteangense]
MSIEIDSLEDLDDQGQDESSSEYYSPQLESTSTFTPNFTAATETALSTPDSFNLGTTSLRCKCGALISYDDLISRGTIPSHDISNSGYHLELGEWLCDLTKAIDAAWPKRHITYSDVHVLIITWEETDMRGMENEIKRLSSVFSDVFGYNIHRLIIPTSKADLRVRREVDSFIEEYGQQENLLIVYYAGHARPGLRTGSPPIWYPKKPTAGEPGASFDTNNILPILARAQDDSPDVLLIYDCCHSLSSHSINDEPSRAIVECLFAGGFETKVPIAGLDSFTHALYDELFIASKSSMPLSVTDLHRKIIDRLQNWIPHGVFNRDGTILRDNKTKEPVITQPVRTTPIHMFLSENEEPRTIFLAPNKQQRPETPNDDDSKNGEDELPRVLLAIRLVENDCNSEALKSFKKWILDAPQCVVKFEKLYQSYSELLLVEMPLQVWDLLPRNPAVTFIGFTKGEKPIEMLTTNVDGTPAAIGNPVIVSHKFESLGEDSSVETQPQSDNQMAHQTFAGTQLINLVDRPDSHMYHSERKEHRGLNTVLGAVDQILPKTFTDLEKSAKQNGLQLKILFDQVLENLVKLEVPGEEEIMSRDDILRYEAFLFQYVSAKHLIRYGPPWLNVENRLTGPMARLYDWYNDDIRAGSASIPEIPEIGENETSSEPSTNHSKLWSNPSIGGRSSAIRE